MRATCIFVVAKALEDKFAALVKGGENSKVSEKGEIIESEEKVAYRRHNVFSADLHKVKAVCDCLDNGFMS
jgi:hypothetical protein